MHELIVKTMISDQELEQKVGKIATDQDYNVLITRDTRVFKPDGKLLCVLRRGVVSEKAFEDAYAALSELGKQTSDNRGLASGTTRQKIGTQLRTRSARVPSTIVGAFDSTAMYKQCRLTAWTAEHVDRFETLVPIFKEVADVFAEEVPDRFAVQAGWAAKTDPHWVIKGTPFTTITINNTYPTGVHTDKGDLDEGFSCLCVHRRGDYAGGVLMFPRYRVAVDLYDGDLVMMDAHEFHGNTEIEKKSEDAERISIVHYYRTGMRACGTPVQEGLKAQREADRKAGIVANMEMPF